jgi:hypothetical protein
MPTLCRINMAHGPSGVGLQTIADFRPDNGICIRNVLPAVMPTAHELGWLDPARRLPQDTVIAGQLGRTPDLPSACVPALRRNRECSRCSAMPERDSPQVYKRGAMSPKVKIFFRDWRLLVSDAYNAMG